MTVLMIYETYGKLRQSIYYRVYLGDVAPRVFQRGRKLFFLPKHEISCSNRKCSYSSMNFVLQHDLVRALAQYFCCRTKQVLLEHEILRSTSYCSTRFRIRARSRLCRSSKFVLLQHAYFVRDRARYLVL